MCDLFPPLSQLGDHWAYQMQPFILFAGQLGEMLLASVYAFCLFCQVQGSPFSFQHAHLGSEGKSLH